MTRCKRCGKRWCGTDGKLIKLYGPDYASDALGLDGQIARVTFGTKKCRDKGPKR